MDKIFTVEQMQKYLEQYGTSEGFSMEIFYKQTGYTKRHADRLFREFLHMTPAEYLRAVRLSESARDLAQTDKSILEIALDYQYTSHEAYTRAFSEQFHATPKMYRKGQKPIPLFLPNPITHYFILLERKEKLQMKGNETICTVSAVQRPERKLIFLRAKRATDYFSFCEECGCDWYGLLDSILSKLESPGLITLPEFLLKEGYTDTACGIEVPFDYAGEVPKGYEIATLPPCEMLFFQTEPFEREEDFPEAIEAAFSALAHYDFQRYGFVRADQDAPFFNFGFSAQKGASLAVPVRRI